MTDKQKTLAEIRDALAAEVTKNNPHKETSVNQRENFCFGFDVGVSEMKKRAEVLVEGLRVILVQRENFLEDALENIYTEATEALEAYRKSVGYK